jgi:hypothetical protein
VKVLGSSVPDGDSTFRVTDHTELEEMWALTEGEIDEVSAYEIFCPQISAYFTDIMIHYNWCLAAASAVGTELVHDLSEHRALEHWMYQRRRRF